MAIDSLDFQVRFSRYANFSDEFKDRVCHVMQYYPMLRLREITIGRSRQANHLGSAYGWTKPQRIYLKPNVPNIVIAHEFTHLIQGPKQGFGIPHGEKACDIWTIDRIPEGEIDGLPHYIIPSRLQNWFGNDWVYHRKFVKLVCGIAIAKRNVSLRHYIKFVEDSLKRYAKDQPKS